MIMQRTKFVNSELKSASEEDQPDYYLYLDYFCEEIVSYLCAVSSSMSFERERLARIKCQLFNYHTPKNVTVNIY